MEMESIPLRKTVSLVLGIVCVVLLSFTFVSADKVFRTSWELPRPPVGEPPRYRLVLITQEQDTPFWDKVAAGARKAAAQNGVAIEVWGSYGKDQEDFLKKIEIAIAAKVDGIIAQGLDTEGFKYMSKIQAASYGIPIITVGSDVPMVDSLRRTYVGSDQFLAGQMIAQELVADMGKSGTVILLGDDSEEYYQQQRLGGIRNILAAYSRIKTEYVKTPVARERIIAATQDAMNRLPDVNAFVAVNANIADAMVQEIGRRSRVEPFHIYSFDDSPDTLSLLKQGKLDGMIEQSPEEMGRKSVDLMVRWLNGETVPLNKDGYLTDIRMLKAEDVR